MAARLLKRASLVLGIALLEACGAFDFATPELAATAGNAGVGGHVASNGGAHGSAGGGQSAAGGAQSAAGGGQSAAGGARSSGGASTSGGSGGEGCNGNLPFPSTSLLDDFERSTLGENWVAPPPNSASSLGAYKLSNGRLSTTEGLDQAIFWKSTQGSNQEVYATLVDYDPHLYGTWLILKSETQSYDGFAIALQYGADFNGGNYFALSVNDGGWRDVASSGAEVKRGQVFGARSFANGCLEAFIDGELVLSADLSKEVTAEEYQRTGTYIGLSNVLGNEDATQPTVWDKFGGGTF